MLSIHSKMDTSINLNEIDFGMKSFTYSTNLHVLLINALGDALLSSGSPCSFCQLFQTHCSNDCPCSQTHLYASKQAFTLGEPYIFMCPIGFTHIAMAISIENAYKAAFIAGPFLMDEHDECLISDLYKKYHLPETLKPLFEDYLFTIPIISPQITHYYAHLIECIASSIMLKHFYSLQENQQRTLQQRRISEMLQHQKDSSDLSFSYPYFKEKELLNAVRSGDTPTACALLNDLLGHIFFSYGNNLNIIKPRVLELCTLLSRTVVETTQNIDETLSLNSLFLQQLTEVNDLDSLCFLLEKIIRQFTEDVLQMSHTANSSIIRRAINYMNTYYSTAITLSDVASHVNLNPSYFSTLFKKETGYSFSQFLNMTRIEHSKLLLRNTDASIIDVALDVGFDTDSYFCTVFKKIVGLSPKHYRLSNL